MKIVLLGAPGVGKGTYAKILVEKYRIPHISTGDLCRSEIKKGTELGKKAKPQYDSGLLVSDDIVLPLLKKRIAEKDAESGFLLDGFPRTIGQADILETIAKIDKVISFEASEEIILQRLSGRRTCVECGAVFHIKNMPPKKEGFCDVCGGELYQREDEKPAAIIIRLETYKKETSPLKGYYARKGLLMNVDAGLPIDQVGRIVGPIFEELNKL